MGHAQKHSIELQPLCAHIFRLDWPPPQSVEFFTYMRQKEKYLFSAIKKKRQSNQWMMGFYFYM